MCFWGSLQIWNSLDVKSFLILTKHIKIEQVTKNLLADLLLPKEIAIIKVELHSKHQDPPPPGNAFS